MIIKKYILFLNLILLFLVSECACAELRSWAEYEKAVRDHSITKEQAQNSFPVILDSLYAQTTGAFSKEFSAWVFPLEGYSRRAMLKSDFKPHIKYGPEKVKGYDFFDGNRHGGHPAYDIFIKDKDQDSIDDKTKKPARALAMIDMLILSVNTGWSKGSNIRGGNYIWAFNPTENKLFYYAHLGEIFVEEGRLAKRGEALGTVGRTGRLADSKASPTHIHLMVLDISKKKPTPYNYFKKLFPQK